MPKDEENLPFKSLDEINTTLAKLKDFIKNTIALYYDDIIIQEFVNYDFKDDFLVGQFLAENDLSYLFQIDKEGEPTLVQLPNTEDDLQELEENAENS